MVPQSEIKSETTVKDMPKHGSFGPVCCQHSQKVNTVITSTGAFVDSTQNKIHVKQRK